MSNRNSSKNSKNEKYVKFAWEDVNLICEWDGCNEESSMLSFYLKHVDDHMRKYTSQQGEHACLWTGCESEPLTGLGLHCHVMYHAFHMKLKSYGHNVLSRKKMPGCRLEDKTKNLIPDTPEGMKCQWGHCNDYLLSPESFYRHVDIHAEDYPKGNKISVSAVCQWQGCNGSFSSQYKLKEHLRAHTQEKMVACPTCGGMFASRTKLIDHVYRQILAKKPRALYQCDFCSKNFASERLLRDHTRCHVNHYKCPYCNMTCPTPSSLKGHVLYRHSAEKQYPCPDCSYRAKSQNDLRRHMDMHSNAEYDCPDDNCDFRTQSEGALLHHMRRFHQDRSFYSCHICDMQFTRGTYLTKHLMVSHQLRWPAGHSRFRYKKDVDGYYRLQMVRYETIELSEQLQMLEEKKQNNSMDISENSLPCEDDTDELDDPDSVNPNHSIPEGVDPLLNSPLVIYIPPAAGDEQPNNSLESQYSNREIKKIQLLTTASDGSTVLQTAEVIAEGGSADI